MIPCTIPTFEEQKKEESRQWTEVAQMLRSTLISNSPLYLCEQGFLELYTIAVVYVMHYSDFPYSILSQARGLDAPIWLAEESYEQIQKYKLSPCEFQYFRGPILQELYVEFQFCKSSTSLSNPVTILHFNHNVNS